MKEISERLRSFSPSEMMTNIDKVSHIVRKIRLKQGGIGSDEDEVVLYRMMMDLKFMVDTADGLTAYIQQLEAGMQELNAQLSSLREVYERRLQEMQQKMTANGNIQSAKTDL